MEGSIGKRYVPEKPILPLPNGMIYVGMDLSLNRNVILYGVDNSDDTFTAKYLRQLREASQFTGENFMHILDLGIDTISNRLMAILKPCNGIHLSQEIGRQALTFEESVRLVYELSTTMQKAMIEGIPEFSVHPDNLWLNEEKQIVVMNYWEQGPSRHRGPTGLCGLLYQLVTGSATVPLSWNTMEILLQEQLQAIPVQQKDDLMNILHRTASGGLSLKEFSTQLRQLLSFRVARAITEKAPDEQVHRRGMDYSIRQDVPLNKKADVEPIKRSINKSNEDRVLDSFEEETDDSNDSGDEKKSFGWLAKRVLLFGSAFAAIAILAAFILIGLIDSHNPKRGSEQAFTEQSTAAQKQPVQQETVVPKETKPEQAVVATPPAAGQPVAAPSLIGLTREQAEKSALAAGLHYQFFMEANDQAKNTVFKQDPQPNTTVSSGGNISFWIGK